MRNTANNMLIGRYTNLFLRVFFFFFCLLHGGNLPYGAAAATAWRRGGWELAAANLNVARQTRRRRKMMSSFVHFSPCWGGGKRRGDRSWIFSFLCEPVFGLSRVNHLGSKTYPSTGEGACVFFRQPSCCVPIHGHLHHTHTDLYRYIDRLRVRNESDFLRCCRKILLSTYQEFRCVCVCVSSSISMVNGVIRLIKLREILLKLWFDLWAM